MMPVVAASMDVLAPLLYVVVGAALMPFAGRLPRALLALSFVVTYAIVTISLVDVARAILTHGRWDLVGENGFTGAVLRVSEPIAASVDPLRLALLVVVHLCGGVALVGARQAFGGGARRAQTPASAGQRATTLVLLGVVELAVVVDRVDHLALLAAVGSVVAGLLLLASKARPEGVHGVAWLFALHRVGDTALLVLVVALVASGLPLEEHALVRALLEVDLLHRATEGPLSGFPWQSIVDVCFVASAIAFATRALVFPFSSTTRDVVDAPMPVLLAAHGLGGLGLGLVVWTRLAFLAHAAPTLASATVVVLLALAALGLASALSITELPEIDVRMLSALACLVAAAVVVGDLTAVALGLTLTLVVAGVALLADGAAIEAMQGTHDLLRMGGLWRALRLTDAARAIATFSVVGVPGLMGFAFYDALFTALASRTTTPAPALVLAPVVVVLLGLVCLRSLHLVFVGDAPRGAAPARLVAPSRERSLTWLFVVVTASGFGLFFGLPDVVIDAVVPGAFQPLAVFLFPSSLPNLALMVHAREMAPFVLVDGRALVLGLVAALSAVVYAISFALYRRRPSAPGLASDDARLARVRGALASDLSAMPFIERFVQNPILDVARAIARVARPIIVDGLLGQAPRGAGALLAVTARVLHVGDVQRALLVVLAVVAALALWGRG